ncbi:MAG TPA: glycosyltransferase family 1 protein [Ideonella sp.]|nr:glycosyltransferase family 1 protein [Ideonella sp.]
MTTCYVNGKFLMQRMTGVQRFAAELVRATDGLLQAGALPGTARRWVLLHPPGARPPAYRHIESRAVGAAGQPLHLWEQGALPLAARRGLLLNLAGSAPWFAARQVCTFHDAAVFDRPEAYTTAFKLWYRALFRHAGRRASRVLTVSEFSRGRLVACLGLAPGRIGVVPNAADHLAAVSADPGVLGRLGLLPARYLLAVASANPSKNLAALQAAFARLPAGLGLNLVIVGGANAGVFASGSSGAPAQAGSRVLHTGVLPDSELKALYQQALALVFPSLYEGFGLPPLEAMACDCPVIAARAAALPEVCGDAALYVDPASVDEMAAALHRLAVDGAERERLRSAGRLRAAAFSWRRSAECLLREVEAVA